jgi:hypothetical protein
MAADRRGSILAGICGGLFASVAMKAVVHFFDPGAFGLSSETDADAARALLGPGLEQKSAERIGSAMHYGFGIATAAGYAVVSERFPVIRTAGGAAFGGVLWLVGDELAVTATRLADPVAASYRSHLSALAAHLLYGLVVDAFVPKRS